MHKCVSSDQACDGLVCYTNMQCTLGAEFCTSLSIYGAGIVAVKAVKVDLDSQDSLHNLNSVEVWV